MICWYMFQDKFQNLLFADLLLDFEWSWDSNVGPLGSLFKVFFF